MLKLERQQIISELYDKISNNKLKHNNTVIMGDNAIGKTFLLKSLNNSENTMFINCPFDKKLLENLDTECDIILIDNIETALSFREILNINTFINNKLINKKLIIVTHNLELISSLKDFNIINICKNCYGIYDGNDFNTYFDVKNIIDDENNAADIILTTLLNLKLCDFWTSVEEERLLQIKAKSLTVSQNLLLDEIIYYF